MMQIVTFTPFTDGFLPRCDSAFPNGGDRGSDASDVLFSGSSAHGGRARIYTRDGVYLFGAASPPHHAELAGSFKASGSNLDPSLAFGSNSFSVETTNLRAANVGRMYKGLGVGRLTQGYQDDAIPASSKNLYFSYHAKFGCDPFRVYVASIASKTGDLQGGADRSRGERCTIVQSEGGTIEGWVTYENGSYVSVEVDSGGSQSGMQGAVITGQTSGNSVTTGAESTSVGATKYSRIFHGSTGEPTRSSFVTSHTSGGIFDFDSWDNNVLDDHQDVDQLNCGRALINEWYFIENEYYYSGSSWRVRVKINGNIWFEDNAIYGLDLGSSVGIRPTLIGLDTPGTGGIPAEQVGTSEFIDSIVYQNNLSRIVLTDNQTYSLSTKFEVQGHVEWKNSYVDFYVNRGEITSGGWLHIFDATGTVLAVLEIE